MSDEQQADATGATPLEAAAARAKAAILAQAEATRARDDLRERLYRAEADAHERRRTAEAAVQDLLATAFGRADFATFAAERNAELAR